MWPAGDEAMERGGVLWVVVELIALLELLEFNFEIIGVLVCREPVAEGLK